MPHMKTRMKNEQGQTMTEFALVLPILIVLLFLLGVVERKRPTVALIFAAAFAAGTYFLFDTLLRVPLPRGPFGI